MHCTALLPHTVIFSFGLSLVVVSDSRPTHLSDESEDAKHVDAYRIFAARYLAALSVYETEACCRVGISRLIGNRHH